MASEVGDSGGAGDEAGALVEGRRPKEPDASPAEGQRERRSFGAFFKSRIGSGDYENAELEMLYRRYILKLQQNSITSALGLLVAVMLIMCGVSGWQ